MFSKLKVKWQIYFLMNFFGMRCDLALSFLWLHYCRRSHALMCCWTVWLKIVNSASQPYYKLPCQEITLTGTCESVWCVCMFVLHFGARGRVSVRFTLDLCMQLVLCMACFDVFWLFTVWWRRLLSTWLTCWRTVETKYRRTCWPMEVQWWLQHSVSWIF